MPAGAGALVEGSAPAGSSYSDPVGAYLVSLSTEKSRKTAVESMRRIARCLGVQVDARDHDAWRRIPWTSLTYAETNMVRAQLVGRAKPATARLTLAVLKRVLRAAYRLRLISADQYQRAIDLERVPGKSVRPGRELTADDMARLEAHFVTLEEPYRQMVRALFAVGIGAGLRREELCRLLLGGVEAAHLVFVGKGLKEARQPIAAWARAVLEEWLQARKGFQTPTVFLRYDVAGEVLLDAPMTPKMVWELVVREAKAAGIAKISTHDLRRTFGTRAIRKDALHAKTLLRHEDMGTTELYDRRSDDGARQLLDELEPMMAPTVEAPVPPKITEAWLAFASFVAGHPKLKGSDPLNASPSVVRGFLCKRREAGRTARELAGDANEVVMQLKAAKKEWWTAEWVAEVGKELARR